MKYHISITQKTLLADMYAPVSIYCELRDVFAGSLLFESADYHDRTDNKSYICLDPLADFIAKDKTYSIRLPDGERVHYQATTNQDVSKAFEEFMTLFIPDSTIQNETTQGLFGYATFESIQYYEDIILNSKYDEDKDIPDLYYSLFRFVLIYDHFTKELSIVEHLLNNESNRTFCIHDLQRLIASSPKSTGFTFSTDGAEYSNLKDTEYEELVAKGIQHCVLGNTFQLVVSREFRQKFKGDDFTLYRCLRSVNPSPYLFYLDYGDFKILGSSPESQIIVKEGTATINPIAGTIKRGINAADDIAKAKQLLRDKKEKAEHVMLVDLARNDLSKHSEEVTVATYAEIQYFSQVMHMVSKVNGQLMQPIKGWDVYKDTFPAGTLSGAPKYKAIQLINEFENIARKFYGGAVGFLGFDGTVNQAIIIRSVLSKNNTLIYQAGAGVVASSTPQGELQEVNHKISAIRIAIKNANKL